MEGKFLEICTLLPLSFQQNTDQYLHMMKPYKAGEIYLTFLDKQYLLV